MKTHRMNDHGIELTVAERAAELAAEQRDAELAAPRRRQEGIVHTIPALARSVARLADEALRDALGLGGGLADPAVAIVDPACGPGAFLAAALAVGDGRGHVPAAVIGVDRDAHAVRVARDALEPAFARAGWPCALQAADTLSALQPAAIAQRADVACVIGNPPWIGGAQAKSAPWMRALLVDFERDADGAPLGERKLGVLADAYVRFLRWSLEVARLARRGAVLALVTNGSYLDGPVHRGLRAMLLRELDALSVIDLGGNALLARSGARDDNVFGVRPQVAVLIATRSAEAPRTRSARLRYLRIHGPLQGKLDRLEQLAWRAPELQAQATSGPLYRLVPTAEVGAEYASWPSLPELMPFHREGVQTNRDAVAIDADRAVLLARMQAFAQGREQPALAPALAPLAHYDPARARARMQAALAADPAGEGWIRPLQYRPFDARWFVALAPLCHRPRPDLLAAMDRSTLALVSVRKDRGALPWTHAAASRLAIDNCLLSTRSSCRARAFPSHAPDGGENLAPAAARELAARVGRVVGSHELIGYALAVLSAPSFRERYDAALRVDYPRIPWPRDGHVFDALTAAGQRIAQLHTTPLELPAGTAVARSEAARDRAAAIEREAAHAATLLEL